MGRDLRRRKRLDVPFLWTYRQVYTSCSFGIQLPSQCSLYCQLAPYTIAHYHRDFDYSAGNVYIVSAARYWKHYYPKFAGGLEPRYHWINSVSFWLEDFSFFFFFFIEPPLPWRDHAKALNIQGSGIRSGDFPLFIIPLIVFRFFHYFYLLFIRVVISCSSISSVSR